jgi:hypothetical protein
MVVSLLQPPRHDGFFPQDHIDLRQETALPE